MAIMVVIGAVGLWIVNADQRKVVGLSAMMILLLVKLFYLPSANHLDPTNTFESTERSEPPACPNNSKDYESLANRLSIAEEQLGLVYNQVVNSFPILDFLDESAFFASSVLGDGVHNADRVRLSQPNAYHPARDNYQNQFVTVDLGRVVWITSMEVWGRGIDDQYVTYFELQFKENAIDNFQLLTPIANNLAGLFQGPRCERCIAHIRNFRPFKARFMKFIPKCFNKVPSFKWEVYGYNAEDVKTIHN